MTEATVLALIAAGLHASWNLAVKRSTGNRFHMMWGQVVLGSLFGSIVFVALGGMEAAAWPWAVLSGIIHVPYAVLLARAYDTGDFSQVYPLARGAGALVAGLGGIVLLDDRLSGWGLIAIGVVVAGLVVIAGRAPGPAAIVALSLGGVIGSYTIVDSQGSRASGVAFYGLATGAMAALAITAFAFSSGRYRGFVDSIRHEWKPMLLGGIAQKVTYTFVLAAVRLAPVGYVTALRETSVVLAVLLGWLLLGETRTGRRAAGSVAVLAGVVVLVVVARVDGELTVSQPG